MTLLLLLGNDVALKKLALIVRAADIKGQERVADEGIGLRSIAQGFAAMDVSDEERLTRQFPYTMLCTRSYRVKRDAALRTRSGFDQRGWLSALLRSGIA